MFARFKKALYGLKQAPCVGHEKFTITISSLGFVANSFDYAISVKYNDAGRVIISLYVDNMIIIGEDVDGN